MKDMSDIDELAGGGATPAELAVAKAARAVEAGLMERFFGLDKAEAAAKAQDGEAALAARQRHADPAANAGLVKAACGKLGADLVGICDFDRAWLRPGKDGRPAELPGDYARAVVMAVAMDRVAIAASPAPAATRATAVGYMRMAVVAVAAADFIRRCGYKALPTRNKVAYNVPLAVAAGLGEIGHSGLLVTKSHGPCVRICKVFTDMPLAADAPVEFGVREYCGGCGACVGGCPVGAILAGSSDPAGVDGKRCQSFWRQIGHNCSTCIALCPFTDGPGK